MTTRYVLDDTAFVYEILEDEIVLVNLENGYYYILDEVASSIWLIIRLGKTIEETIDVINYHYEGQADIIREETSRLVNELAQEGILQVQDSSVSTLPVQTQPDVLDEIGSKKRFHTPTLFKFTDMEYLIQMDPVWEYDESGWPKRRTNPPPPKA
jgi:hypothetical protein